MDKTFIAVAEERPGPQWQREFRAAWPRVRSWYLREDVEARPTVGEARAALGRHMPELVPIYETVCRLAGDDDVAHRMLSNYGLPPVIVGCTQGVWHGAEGPALVRNYDFDVTFTTGCILASRWFRRRVIAMAEAGWGCLDGMNEDGLVVSLTFGGRPAHGRGFAMPLVLRYALETCATVKDAVAAIIRMPVSMAQNVTILDASGDVATVFVAPDREPGVAAHAACANHQEEIVWPEHAARSRPLARLAAHERRLHDPAMTLDALVEGMLRPPLYQLDVARGGATVYTAVYRPRAGAVDYAWPGRRWRQEFDRFEAGTYTHRYA